MKGFDKKYKSFPDYILKITKQIWEGKDVNSIANYYTEDIPVRSPFGVTYGNKPVIDATFATLREFPNRQLLGEDIIWNKDAEDGYHSSHRILSKGTHLGDGHMVNHLVKTFIIELLLIVHVNIIKFMTNGL